MSGAGAASLLREAGKVARRAGWDVARCFEFGRFARPHEAARISRCSWLRGCVHAVEQSRRKKPVLTALGLFTAGLFVAAAAAQEAGAQKPILSPGREFVEQGGAAIYASVCAACHQPDAKGASGAGAYPALAANSELASADYVLEALFQGLRGMPPVGRMLNDAQAADVVNYVRSHFGNDYRDQVSATAVQAARSSRPGN